MFEHSSRECVAVACKIKSIFAEGSASAAPEFRRIRAKKFPYPLPALILFLIMVHRVLSATLNCTVDEVPGISDGIPACYMDSCRAKYKDKQYWCAPTRLCVYGPNFCNETDLNFGSPPPPRPRICGTHSRGFNRSTNSCVCEEGWYTDYDLHEIHWCESQKIYPPWVYFVYIFSEDEGSVYFVILIILLASLLAICIVICSLSSFKSLAQFWKQQQQQRS